LFADITTTITPKVLFTYYVLIACFYQTIFKTLNPAQMLTVNLQPFPVLDTKRLIVRAVTLNDAEGI
jgi:hypothetical protein